MRDPSVAVQLGLTAALRASPAVKAAMGGTARVYDVAPAKAPFPYLIVGDDQGLPDDAEGIDAADFHLTVNVWSRPGDKLTLLEAKAIAAVVCELIAPPEDSDTAPPALDGFVVKEAVIEGVDHLPDLDRLTAHSIVRARWTIEPL